ncbi:putative isoprenylcysteine alpha-carbonyl methylesterase ICMEL1 [Ananas comosus]|uniref:protein-S-isoprenylcysteine alpha-carbonyl methylesterase n=1 Tax=Ananas comosus TaxID=4615 RepID=A0A199VV99_ANACO|nr:putative isoprenylcysteine alpha-carbonyl methylesterase ICMEL1 [Ananas comosus]
MLLMPGFVQIGYYYFFSRQVRRSIVYGEQPRNRLDLYLPTNMNGLQPVVAFVTGGAWIIGNFPQGTISDMAEDASQGISFVCNNITSYGGDANSWICITYNMNGLQPVVAFVTGGAWIIGYKAWGALLGRRLAERGVIVACIDYRNFPQGTISDMVEDASQGISFVCNNITSYGGDANRIYLVGQSAGAHIAACALLNQAIKECGEGESSSWSVSQIKAYFGISGGYNIVNLVDHFHARGLYRSIILSIMEGEQSLRRFSPEVVVRDPSARHAVSLLPHIVLFHGTSDCSIPSSARFVCLGKQSK